MVYKFDVNTSIDMVQVYDSECICVYVHLHTILSDSSMGTLLITGSLFGPTVAEFRTSRKVERRLLDESAFLSSIGKLLKCGAETRAGE